MYIDKELNKVSISAEYDWRNVEVGQSATYSVPYGITRLNYDIKKAIVQNGALDNFLSLGSSTQVNPGAQLCSSNSNYQCKYQVEQITIIHNPHVPAYYNATMIEHKPVNSGQSGSQAYSIGAGFGSGGVQTSISYSFSQNWTSISLTDQSNFFGDWKYTISGDTQKEVVTVSAGSTHIFSESRYSASPGLSANVIFDSWNTGTYQAVAYKEKYFTW